MRFTAGADDNKEAFLLMDRSEKRDPGLFACDPCLVGCIVVPADAVVVVLQRRECIRRDCQEKERKEQTGSQFTHEPHGDSISSHH
jgi:hypothetical protein